MPPTVPKSSPLPRDVVVLGGGVTGLTSAICLAENGHRVRIVAEGYLRETTSWVATAIWHIFWVSMDERIPTWAAQSLHQLLELADDPRSGVTRVVGRECVRSSAPESDPVHSEEGDFWKALVPHYETLSREKLVQRLPDGYPIESFTGGYEIEVPIADMSIYLPYLMARLDDLGVERIVDRVESFDELRSRHPSDVFINATGLGARTLTGDTELVGIKGQIVRVSKGTVDQYIADDYSPRGMTYVLPRGNDIVLGGSEDEGLEDTAIDYDLGQRILDRCVQLVPELASSTVLEHMAGVRPFRRNGVRLERDPDHPDVIHSYGHGGSGVSLSWGCAAEVVRLVELAEGEN